LLGGLIVAGLHYATFKNDSVHYHANFALYVNGQRDEFKSFSFYEEVQACSSDDKNDPKARVHMHDQNSGLVHVHAKAVTWSQLFANLGYSLGDKVLTTDSGVYIDGQDGSRLTFILNGRSETVLANRVINSEDRLLINYGKDDQATLQQRYDRVPSDAHQANTEHDPASCRGSTELTTWQRLKKAFID
ncbi:hypothetical protein HY218_02245, partial [Candidatus Saccharibacteria bacterium]|nr:hypothetical protein [Candidatus Saccharibacteria bacterium]